MLKPLLFYVIDEHMDEIKYCKKRGLLPYKFKDRVCYCSDPLIGNQNIKSVIQYTYKGYTYDALDGSQCYSGYMVTLMRLPKPQYEELLKTALTSKKNEERAGSIGMILKDYPSEFEKYLLAVKNMDFNALEDKKGIKRIVDFINDFIRQNSSYVWPLEKILSLCEELKIFLK
jgi:hypothetical protein